MEHLNLHFKSSKDDAITRYFHEIPASDIKVHTAPVDSLKIGDEGPSEHHIVSLSQE